MRAVIVGAGIGGLAAAVALRRAGVEVVVLERAPVVREAGAGLSLWSNATNALRELGVYEAVLASASVVERTSIRTAAGREIAVSGFADIVHEAGAPCICASRPALQRALLEALPPDAVHPGTRCTGFAGAAATVEDGRKFEGDVLVGADGISSVIREGLHGVSTPRYAGYTCWRGICRDDDLLPGRSPLLALGPGAQFGAWPCGSGQVYWFLTRNTPPGRSLSKRDALTVCGAWGEPVPQIVAATPEDAILQNDILDRPPLRRWGRGPVTLLGDAAHATTPNLGQGACQSLEDAVTLADCLKRISPAEGALRAYERLRIPRTTAVVRDSRRNGRLFQLEQPMLQALRNWMLGTALGRLMGTRALRSLLVYRVPPLAFSHRRMSLKLCGRVMGM